MDRAILYHPLYKVEKHNPNMWKVSLCSETSVWQLGKSSEYFQGNVKMRYSGSIRRDFFLRGADVPPIGNQSG